MPERRGPRLWPALAAVLLLAAACPAGESVLRARGTVVDQSARPLENVSVALAADGRQPHTATTDKDGAFQTSMVGATHGKLTFSKPGYRAAEAAVDTNAPALRIVLQPAP